MAELKENPAAEYIDDVMARASKRLGISTDVEPIKEFSNDELGHLGYLQIIDGGDHPEVLKFIRMRLNFATAGMEANTFQIVTKPNSIVPHCTAEAIFHDPSVATRFRPAHDGPPSIGFFINCLSRVDPGINYKYLQHVYSGFEEKNDEIRGDETIRVAPIPRTQQAIMQPWGCAILAAPWDKFETCKEMAEMYVNRTLELIEEGFPEGMVSDECIARSAMRDKINRATFLSREVDQIWGRMNNLIGESTVDRLIEVLSSQEVETSF